MLCTETCSKLKHQPNTDMPHKNGACISKYLLLSGTYGSRLSHIF